MIFLLVPPPTNYHYIYLQFIRTTNELRLQTMLDLLIRSHRMASGPMKIRIVISLRRCRLFYSFWTP